VGRRSSASTFPFQAGTEGIGALRPKRGLLSDPPLGVSEGVNTDAEPVFAAAHVAADKAGGFEHADVARHGGERHGQRLRQVGDPSLPRAQGLEHGAPRRVGERSVDPVENQMFNHFVDLTVADLIFNRLVERKDALREAGPEKRAIWARATLPCAR
jgi:hypothetical protein